MTVSKSPKPHDHGLLLQGKCAIVTGAGRGIGRAVAKSLASLGASVVVAARTGSQLEEVKAEIEADGGVCYPIPCDLTKEMDCQRLIDSAVNRFGVLDILINNAGTARFKPVWETTADDYDSIMDLNLRGLFLCSREAMRVMIPNRSGTIVSIASSSGRKPYSKQGIYCASKAAVISLTRVMALELRPYHIKVHVICPGAVDTPLADEIHPERDRTDWIKPEDVAGGIVYLLTMPPHVTTDELVIRRYGADPL